ncbi:endonuclease VII domain-containing protein [Streptomyces roseolus]|uniref:endonuclease VII domain-containing protein n=1 Tax=Streptomyces roseolus TaxID=67358 RepID=UPI0036E955D1
MAADQGPARGGTGEGGDRRGSRRAAGAPRSGGTRAPSAASVRPHRSRARAADRRPAGVCVICQEGPAEHVDHDHRTGKVRGVLCFSCNAALGQLKDRPDVIRRAAAYVEGNLWNPTLVARGVYRQPS